MIFNLIYLIASSNVQQEEIELINKLTGMETKKLLEYKNIDDTGQILSRMTRKLEKKEIYHEVFNAIKPLLITIGKLNIDNLKDIKRDSIINKILRSMLFLIRRNSLIENELYSTIKPLLVIIGKLNKDELKDINRDSVIHTVLEVILQNIDKYSVVNREEIFTITIQPLLTAIGKLNKKELETITTNSVINTILEFVLWKIDAYSTVNREEIFTITIQPLLTEIGILSRNDLKTIKENSIFSNT